MSKKDPTFNSLQDLGKHFGISSSKKEKPKESTNETPFLGRKEELLDLKDFIKNSVTNIYGLYGTPMIGKSLLVHQFLKTEFITKMYGTSTIVIKFQNPEDPEITLLETLATYQKSLDNLSFEQPTLLVIENFEECLGWKGNAQKLHSIRKKYSKIKQFLEKVALLSNVKLLIESRFQINTPALGIPLVTLPNIELQGVDVLHFKALYQEEGVTEEEFAVICDNFSNHTWLLAKAYQDMEWLFRNSLNKAVSHHKPITSLLWDLLEKIISRLQKTDTLLLCALTLRSSMPYKKIEQVFEQETLFRKRGVFESIYSLEQKFLIQEKDDVYTINPYLREVCFSFMIKKRSREIKALKSMAYFSTVLSPQYNPIKQYFERGEYGRFFNGLRQLKKQKKYTEAQEILNYAFSLEPYNAKILNEIAVIYKFQKNYPKAIETLQQSIGLKHIPSYNELGIVYKLQGKISEAIETLKQAINLKHIPSHNELAIIYKTQQNYTKAIEILEQALAMAPEDIKTLSQLSIIYKIQGNYEQAIATSNKALTIEPNNSKILNELAIIYKNQKRYEEAITTAKQALLAEPRNVKVINELAQLYKIQKEYDLAIEVVNRGLKIAPNDAYFIRTKESILRAQKGKQPNKKNTHSKPQNSTLQKLIKEDKIKPLIAAALLKAQALNQDSLVTKLHQQETAFANLVSSWRAGTINNMEYATAKIPIRNALYKLLDQLEEVATPTIQQDKSTQQIPPNQEIIILMLTANPSRMTQLNLDKEHSKISEKLQGKAGFSLMVKRAVNKTELKEETETVQPTILHFSGHGTKEQGDWNHSAGIILQNEEKNNKEAISADKLEALFGYFKKEFELQLVILNCCYSKPQAAAIAQHVPFVIGTTNKVKDSSAISFSTGFYFKYASTNDVVLAFDSGRTEAVLNDAQKEDFIIFKQGEQLDV